MFAQSYPNDEGIVDELKCTADAELNVIEKKLNLESAFKKRHNPIQYNSSIVEEEIEKAINELYQSKQLVYILHVLTTMKKRLDIAKTTLHEKKMLYDGAIALGTKSQIERQSKEMKLAEEKLNQLENEYKSSMKIANSEKHLHDSSIKVMKATEKVKNLQRTIEKLKESEGKQGKKLKTDVDQGWDNKDDEKEKEGKLFFPPSLSFKENDTTFSPPSLASLEQALSKAKREETDAKVKKEIALHKAEANRSFLKRKEEKKKTKKNANEAEKVLLDYLKEDGLPEEENKFFACLHVNHLNALSALEKSSKLLENARIKKNLIDTTDQSNDDFIVADREHSKWKKTSDCISSLTSLTKNAIQSSEQLMKISNRNESHHEIQHRKLLSLFKNVSKIASEVHEVLKTMKCRADAELAVCVHAKINNNTDDIHGNLIENHAIAERNAIDAKKKLKNLMNSKNMNSIKTVQGIVNQSLSQVKAERRAIRCKNRISKLEDKTKKLHNAYLAAKAFQVQNKVEDGISGIYKISKSNSLKNISSELNAESLELKLLKHAYEKSKKNCEIHGLKFQRVLNHIKIERKVTKLLSSINESENRVEKLKKSVGQGEKILSPRRMKVAQHLLNSAKVHLHSQKEILQQTVSEVEKERLQILKEEKKEKQKQSKILKTIKAELHHKITTSPIINMKIEEANRNNWGENNLKVKLSLSTEKRGSLINIMRETATAKKYSMSDLKEDLKIKEREKRDANDSTKNNEIRKANRSLHEIKNKSKVLEKEIEILESKLDKNDSLPDLIKLKKQIETKTLQLHDLMEEESIANELIECLKNIHREERIFEHSTNIENKLHEAWKNANSLHVKGYKYILHDLEKTRDKVKESTQRAKNALIHTKKMSVAMKNVQKIMKSAHDAANNVRNSTATAKTERELTKKWNTKLNQLETCHLVLAKLKKEKCNAMDTQMKNKLKHDVLIQSESDKRAINYAKAGLENHFAKALKQEHLHMISKIQKDNVEMIKVQGKKANFNMDTPEVQKSHREIQKIEKQHLSVQQKMKKDAKLIQN
eukprot:g970.t1